MRDLTHQQIKLRTARAMAVVFCAAATIEKVKNNQLPEGNLFETARAAGFLGAKAAPQLLPHKLVAGIDSLQIEFEVLEKIKHAELFGGAVPERSGILIRGEAKTIGRSGLEMEILTAVSVAGLEIFEKLKAIDTALEIGYIKLLEKKGKGESKKYFATPPTCAVLVCSDSTAAGTREDSSGKLIVEMLEQVNAQVKYYQVLPDSREQIQEQIMKWVEEDLHFIFTTGGTGLGPRDNTVSAVKDILERDAEGIAEAMRGYGQMRTPLAMMSRGVAGSIAQTLIVTLPGSSNGARESLEAILPAVFHARKMMKGGGH